MFVKLSHSCDRSYFECQKVLKLNVRFRVSINEFTFALVPTVSHVFSSSQRLHDVTVTAYNEHGTSKETSEQVCVQDQLKSKSHFISIII